MGNQVLNCARCGKPVSSGVFSCPHCGERKFRYIPCYHCNTLTKEFEIIELRTEKCDQNLGEVYVSSLSSTRSVYLTKQVHYLFYCPHCYNSIIKVNKNTPLPVIPQMSIKCPTCNHLFNHQPQLTKYDLSYISDSFTTQNLTCPNCGETNCKGVFNHSYVKCFWCDGALNYNDGVKAYKNAGKNPYDEDIVRIYLHKTCATKKNLEELGAKIYSPLEFFLPKLKNFISATVGSMLIFLVIHFILKLMKIDIFPLFVIASLMLGIWSGYSTRQKSPFS